MMKSSTLNPSVPTTERAAPTVADAFTNRPNNFDAIRLGAALLVLFSHAFALTGAADAEPVARLLQRAMDGGSLAVATFFVLSGFLIARSATIHRPAAFARARVLRIYPAYLVLLLLQTFALGLAMSTHPWSAYLTDRATWVALLTGLALSPRLGLPGVFEANPLPLEVNGSLWTLRIEALCYVVAALLARSRRSFALTAALSVLLLVTILAVPLPPAPLAILRDALFFAAGMLLWLARDRIILHPAMAALAAAAFLLLAGTPLAVPVAHLALPYLVIWLGLAPRLPPRLTPRADLSYGAYLYAFPVQQCLVALIPGLGPYPLAALALIPVLLLAWLSHKLVEAPALALK